MAIPTYTVLTDKDRLGIVKSHIKNKEYTLYNDELEMMVETTAPTPDQGTIDAIETRTANNVAKIDILKGEAGKLEASIAIAAAAAKLKE